MDSITYPKKISRGRKNDLETIVHFIPKKLRDIPITEQDINKFFELSEEGKHKSDVKMSHFDDGFNVLVEGKRWRGVHMGMYEEGILEGSTPYWTLLGGEDKREIMPRTVVDFIKKELFKGIDADMIESCYERVLYKWTPWYKKIWNQLHQKNQKEN